MLVEGQELGVAAVGIGRQHKVAHCNSQNEYKSLQAQHSFSKAGRKTNLARCFVVIVMTHGSALAAVRASDAMQSLPHS